MTNITIISGFLGAGKTTLIRKLLAEAYAGEKVVLIENEFGEIGIDGGFLQEAGVEVKEMNAGCICCSLVGDFEAALTQVLQTYAPQRILIEPSGVGKLSDVARAVEHLQGEVRLDGKAAVADATKCRMYLKNFGEFYADQIASADAILLSRTQGMGEDKLAQAVALLREVNSTAPIVTTPWEELAGSQLAQAIVGEDTLQDTLEQLEREVHAHGHSHEEEHCCCGHDHAHGHSHEEEHCCCGHDHAHGHSHEEEHCCCGHDDAHGHSHEEHGCCGHDDAHGHSHHADAVFDSLGVQTPRTYTQRALQAALAALDSGDYGTVLRAKGIVPGAEGVWLHFDYVPGEHSVRTGTAGVTGRLCIIGAQLQKEKLQALFGV